MGFKVEIETVVWPKYHKTYSAFAIKTITRNLDALLPWKQLRTIKYEGITVHIGPNEFAGFLYLPFMLVHEYLHFIIGYFSRRYNLMVLIPPLLDVCYLPLILLFRFQPFELWFLITLYVFWVFIIRLGWNLTGDFAPYLRIGKKHSEPHSSEP